MEHTKRAFKGAKAGVVTCMAGASALALFYLTGGGTPSPAALPTQAATQTVAKQAGEWSSVIIQGIPGRPMTKADEAQIAKLGGKVYRHLGILSGGAVRIPTRNLTQLAALPFIKHVSPDSTVEKTDEFTVEHSGGDMAVAPTSSGGYGLSGTGVTVAVLDSGVRKSDDLKLSLTSSDNRIVVSRNFVGTTDGTGVSDGGDYGDDDAADSGESSGTDDKLGHGTHIAGIIAGNGKASTGSNYFRRFNGIAPRANIISVRVLDDQGSGSVSDVIAGINWVVANKSNHNIRVLNVSLGHPVYESYKTDPLNLAVQAAWKAGIVVVCAAGNNGRENEVTTPTNDNEGFGTAYGSIQVPGNDPYVITVGATKNFDGNRDHDRIATYSSRGPTRIDMLMKPDIIAPGNKIISLVAHDATLDKQYRTVNGIPKSTYIIGGDNKPSDKYFRLSGTSMAAPVVSGAVALMLQKYPTLSPDSVKARLMFSADKWGTPGGATDPLTYGAGYLNIPAALGNTAVVPATLRATSPGLIVAADGFLYVDMSQAIWSRTSTAQPMSLWGTGATESQIIWGANAVINGNLVRDSQAIWGRAGAVKANQAIWGRTNRSAADLSLNTILGEN